MKTILRIMALLIILEANLFASVHVDYPGLDMWIGGFEDTDLPGMPSKDVDEYKEELEAWAARYNIQFEPGTIDRYINESLYIGFDDDVSLTIDGSEYPLYGANATVANQMRDIIFLETLKNSVVHWNDNYIHIPVISFSEAYKRAFKIFSAYQEYIGKGDLFDNVDHNNPIVNALFGAGSCDYGNIIQSDGTIETYLEGEAVGLIYDLGSAAAKNQFFWGDIIGDHIGSSALANLGVSFATNIISQYDSALGLTIDHIATGAFAIAQGGFALVMAPGQMYASTIVYIVTARHESSQGAHLLNYYYFAKNYPDKMQYLLNSEGMIENFVDLKVTFASYIPKDDGIAQGLINHNYNTYVGQNAASEEEARTAYAIASLFMLAEKLDINEMKKNMAARVKLEELKYHNFVLDVEYNADVDAYSVALPEGVANHAEHGGNPVSVNYALNNNELFATYPDAVSNQQMLGGSLVKAFDVTLSNYDDTKKDSELTTEVVYSDGFTMNAASTLDFYPQISNLQLVDHTPNHQIDYSGSDNALHIRFCGDEVNSQAMLFYENGDGLGVGFYDLDNMVSDDGNCREYAVLVDVNELKSEVGFGDVDFYVRLASKESPVVTLPFWDANDTDDDGLPDDWEISKFGDLNQTGTGDFDEDGKTNYQEYVNHTDPIVAGIEEVTETITLKPYQDVNDQWVDIFHLSGNIVSNVVLKSTTTLDLKGKTLTIEGNLIQSGGSIIVNGGRLIVKGDYRIQRESVTQDGTVSYVHSSGNLNMTNEADYVLVNGNFATDSCNSHSDLLTAGTLEVKGDFSQEYTCIDGEYNFKAGGTHRVVLSGDSLQKVRFTSPRIDYSHFNILEINNNSDKGVVFNTPLNTTAFITNGTNINPLKISVMDWEVNEDVAVKGDLNLAGSSLDLKGKTLTVEGDLIHSGGNLIVNGGRLIVKGDYRLQRRDVANDGTVSYAHSSGNLNMTNEADYVLVNGDFVTDSCNSHSDLLTAGTLEVKGDFSQEYTCIDGEYNFKAGGTHRVVLSGDSLQTIGFTNPSIDYSHFNILEITNDGGINFSDPIAVSTLFNHNQYSFTQSVLSKSTFPDYDGDTYKDHVDKFPLDPDKWDGNKPVAGNIDNDTELDLNDAILTLQIMSGITPSQNITLSADINSDKKIGIQEAVYILNNIAN